MPSFRIDMNTPGSLYWVVPPNQKLGSEKCLSGTRAPLINVGRPRGSPPHVISSKPWIPVAAFGSVLAVEAVRSAFFF